MIIASPVISRERLTLANPTERAYPPTPVASVETTNSRDGEVRDPSFASSPDVRVDLDRLKTDLEADYRARKSELEADCKRARADAERDGYAAGIERAEAELEIKHRGVLRRVSEVTDSLVAVRREVAATMEDDLVETILVVVGRVFEEHFVNRNALVSMVKRAISQAREQSGLVIGLHPDDLEEILEFQAQAGNVPALPQGLTFKGDPDIHVGGCRVDSEVGTLDTRLEIVLSRVKETLIEARRTSKSK